jgi:tetratricopeptide (TPR) repeat protein
MDLADQLRVLQAAQGDPAKLALATVDLAYPAMADVERAALKEALEAAAVTHWCDEAILAALLEISAEESAARLARLRQLSVVEPFPARGSNAVNVHEAARLALRQAMAGDPDSRFRALSSRAVRYFRDDDTAAGRIEWIYHLLCADPELGATELEKLDREWSSRARPEEQAALAAALKELDETGLVAGRARARVLLAVAWVRAIRREYAQLGDTAIQALALARSVRDARAEGDSLCLLGGVLEAQGRLAEAMASFQEARAISRRLADQDPTNAGWLRDLAVVHSRVGGVLEAQGELTEARAAFQEALAIRRRLADQDPTNAGWQQELAVAHHRVGRVLEAQSKLAEAMEAFQEALAICRRLADQDSTNAHWQRELAVAHNRVGGVLQAQGKLAEAEAAFQEDLAISRRLADQDPTNSGWQSDLAVTLNRVGEVLEAQGALTEAMEAIQEALVISRRLAEQDPTNAGWQSDLAATLNRVGGVLEAQGALNEARAAFEEALAIRRQLAEQEPGNAGWQSGLAIACARVARLHSRSGRPSAALPLYEEAKASYGALLDRVPGSAEWAKAKETVESELALCRSQAEQDGRGQTSTSRGQDT